MKVIFLDVDGVLNDHSYNADSQSCTLTPSCVREFNRILVATGAVVVLSSAWRYMVSGGELTTKGFAYMLRTHGVRHDIKIVGVTPADEVVPTRGGQIAAWLGANPDVERYVVLDDGPPGMCFLPVVRRLVRTDGTLGLTRVEADLAIEMLGAKS